VTSTRAAINQQTALDVSKISMTVMRVISPSPSAPAPQVEQINNRKYNQHGEEPRPFHPFSALEFTVEVGVCCRFCHALGCHLPFVKIVSLTPPRFLSPWLNLAANFERALILERQFIAAGSGSRDEVP
jgi:hypothetical protein